MGNRDDILALTKLYEAVEEVPPSPELSYTIFETLIKLRKLYLDRKRLRNAIDLAKEISFMPNPPKNIDPELRRIFNAKYAEDLVNMVEEINKLIKKVERYVNDINEDLSIIEAILKKKCGECDEWEKIREAREAWNEWVNKDLTSSLKDGKNLYQEILEIMNALYEEEKKVKKESFGKKVKEFIKKFFGSSGNPPEEGEG